MPSLPANKKRYTKGKKKPRVKRHPLGAPLGSNLGFPNQNVVKLRYVTYTTMTSNGISLGLKQFRANGCFDPDYTSTGHQPMNWDNWVALYNTYTVLGSKITVQGSAIATLSYPCMFGLYISDDPTVPTDWETLRESGRGSQVQLPIASTIKDKSLSCKFSKKQFFKSKGDSDYLNAQTNADPYEVAYFNLYCQSMDKATSIVNNIGCTITIDYIVKFFEPKDMTQN